MVDLAWQQRLKRVLIRLITDELAFDKTVLTSLLLVRTAVHAWGLIQVPAASRTGHFAIFAALSLWSLAVGATVLGSPRAVTSQTWRPSFWASRAARLPATPHGMRRMDPRVRRALTIDAALMTAAIAWGVLIAGDAYRPGIGEWDDLLGMLGPVSLALWGFASVRYGSAAGLVTSLVEVALAASVSGVHNAVWIGQLRLLAVPALMLVGVLRLARLAPVYAQMSASDASEAEAQYAIAEILVKLHNQVKAEADAAAQAISQADIELACQRIRRIQVQLRYLLDVGGRNAAAVDAASESDATMAVWDAVHTGTTRAVEQAMAEGRERQTIAEIPESSGMKLRVDARRGEVLSDAVYHAVLNSCLHAAPRATITVRADKSLSHHDVLEVSVRDQDPEGSAQPKRDPLRSQGRTTTGSEVIRRALRAVNGMIELTELSDGHQARISVPLSVIQVDDAIRTRITDRALAVSTARNSLRIAQANHPDDTDLAAAAAYLDYALERP